MTSDQVIKLLEADNSQNLKGECYEVSRVLSYR